MEELIRREKENRPFDQETGTSADFGFTRQAFDENFQDIHTSYPMNNAWSDLLKRQKRAWETSTKPFKQPKGGFGNEAQQSNRRAKYVRRENPTGPMAFGGDTSVDFDHRTLSTYQPISQADKRKYNRQLAQLKQRKKHFGNVRIVGPRLRTRSDQYSAPMGAPNLTPRRPRLHPVRTPPIVPPKMRRPSLTRPKMPSMVTMSEDSLPEDSLLKAVNKYQLAELRNIMREMRNLLRDKRNEKKKMAEKDVSGGASSLPKHKAGPSDKTSKPTGPTESDAGIYAFEPEGVRVERLELHFCKKQSNYLKGSRCGRLARCSR